MVKSKLDTASKGFMELHVSNIEVGRLFELARTPGEILLRTNNDTVLGFSTKGAGFWERYHIEDPGKPLYTQVWNIRYLKPGEKLILENEF